MTAIDYNREEELMARRDKADLVKNSGRGERKGDAKRNNLLIDYKFTEKASFAVNKDAFNKHAIDAFAEGKEPVIVVVFDRVNRRAIVDWQYLMEIEDELEELRDFKSDHVALMGRISDVYN